jgi:hypothetical protein
MLQSNCLPYYHVLEYFQRGWQCPSCMSLVHYGTSEQNWPERCVNLSNSLCSSARTWRISMPPYATMRLFDPDIRPNDIRPKQQRARNTWFRPGECLRLIYDQLREAAQPVTTRELAERIMRIKAISAADDQRCELVQKTLLGSLNRARQTIARVRPQEWSVGG